MKFSCDGGTYSLDECIKGQAPLTFYDPLAQIALRPSLRQGTILCFWKTGIEGLFQQLMQLLRADKRMVTTNPYYWTEYCNDETITVTVKKSGSAVGVGGAPVTVTQTEGSHSQNGVASKGRVGYRAYIKENNGQAVNITAKNKATAGGHTLTLTPVNGEVLDLTKFPQYTLLIDTMKMYTKGDDNCITGGGLINNPPVLRKGFVQKFEDMICIHEDELDGYINEVDYGVVKGLDRNGKPVDMWTLATVSEKLLEKIIDSRNVNTIFGVRDDVTQKGIDGIVPIAEQQGMFDAGYDTNAGYSFKHILMNMLRRLRKTRGCTDYIIAHDFGFGLDWAEGMSQLVKDSGQGLVYKLFGDGGTGNRSLEYFNFNDFKAFGYQFRTFQIDAFDEARYGAFLTNFAMLIPACQFRDTLGNNVPPVTYTNISASEEAKQQKIWADDTRERGCRTLNVFAKDAYGVEYHCASKLGIWRKNAC